MENAALSAAREALANCRWDTAIEEYEQSEKDGFEAEAKLAISLCNFAIVVESVNLSVYGSAFGQFDICLRNSSKDLDPAFASILALSAAKVFFSRYNPNEHLQSKFSDMVLLGIDQNTVMYRVGKFFNAKNTALVLRGFLLDYVTSPEFSGIDGERQLEILNQCAGFDKFLMGKVHEEDNTNPFMREPRMKAVYKALRTTNPRVLYGPWFKQYKNPPDWFYAVCISAVFLYAVYYIYGTLSLK